MICTERIQAEIARAVGAQHRNGMSPTWSDGTYSCEYVYPDGVMVLSVTDLKSTPDATAHYEALQADFASTTTLDGLGTGAFAAPDGSTFVRKDFYVLEVDVSGVSDHPGTPSADPAELAHTVAEVMSSCWHEHHCWMTH